MEDNDVLGIAGGLVLAVIFLCMMAVAILLIISLWKIFTKAGKPGWAAIVPIYNTIILLEITGRPVWWIFLMLIPLVNIVVTFIVYMDLAKSFGKETVWAVGFILMPFVFFPILAFSPARYLGPSVPPPYPPQGPGGAGGGMVQYPPQQGGPPYR